MARGDGRVFKRGRIWWIQYNHSGRTYRESSASTSEDKARELLRARTKQPSGHITPWARQGTLAELFKLLRADYRANERRDPSRAERAWVHLRRHFTGEVTTAQVMQYTSKRLDQGAARATVNRELNVLSKMLTLGVHAGLLQTKPHVPLLRLNNARRGFIDREQVEALIPCLPPYLQGLIRALWVMGWRRSELTSMRWPQVDFTAGWIRLEPGTTKNDIGREFPLIPELREVFENARDGARGPFVFHRGGARIHTFRKVWKSALKSAGLPTGLFVHDLRRSAARNMIRAGVPAVAVMALCGWKTQAMLARYAIVDTTMLAEAGEKLAALTRGIPRLD